MGQTTKIENAYKFIKSHTSFTLSQLAQASGWTPKTTEKSLWKIGDIVYRDGKNYIPIDNFGQTVSLEQFKKSFSQTRMNTRNTYKYEKLLEKSKNAILSAVQHYNNPLTTFKTESFIVLMTIGFTSLFHAIFEKNGWNYVEKNTDKKYLYDLSKCFQFFRSNQNVTKKYDKTFLEAFDALIAYFKKARNLIEHQLNNVDEYTYGHCQAWLYCYEYILKTEFGTASSLQTLLTSAIQFSHDFPKHIINKELDDFHKDFYSNLSPTVQESPFFKLKVRVVPYKSIAHEDFRQTAVFVSDPTIAAQLAKTDKVFMVATPKKILPTEMVARLTPVIIAKYGPMKFGASHLAKIAKHMKWIKNKQIINYSFMDQEKMGEKTLATRYKEGAEREIEKEIRENPEKLLKSFAPKAVFERWKQLNNKKAKK